MLAIGTGLLALSLGTSSAWAYFSTTGHGTGTAELGRLSVQVLPGSGPAGTGLLPGQVGDAVLRLHNPNSVPLTVIAVQASGPAVADNGCTPTGVSFTSQDQLNVTIPVGADLDLALPGAVSMSRIAAAACQGVGFSIPVTVTVRS